MRKLAVLFVAGAAVLAASAGTLVPKDPTPAVSETTCALDTQVSPSCIAAVETPLDTVLKGWGLSPWPGIFLNTKPTSGLFIVIR